MMKYPALSSFFICCSIIGIFAAKSGGAQSGYDQTQGQQQTGKGPPRYAVIDLGDSSPLKIANTGQVYATQVGTTVACGYRWDQGVWSPLSNLGLDWAVTTDMNNIGTVVGYGHDSSNFNKAAGFNVDSETIGLIWPSFSSSPTSTKSGPTLSYTLNFTRYDSDAKKTYTGPVTATESFLEINFIDSAGDVYGPQYNQQVGSYLGGDQGPFFMPVENLFDFTSNDMLTDVVGTEDASGYSQTGSYGRIISASLGGVVFEHDANQQTGAPFDLILNGIVIASDPQQDSFGDDYYLNDYGAMAYTDSTSDLPMIIDGQTNSELPQYPVSINNRTVPGPGGSSIHAWQILGFEDLMEPAIDPVSHLPNGQYTQQTDTPISDLLNSEAQNAWTAFAVTGINDNGAIVGTATYTPPTLPPGTSPPANAPSAGQHGVMLLPCQSSLLNGNQGGTDGLNFDGTRPQKISATVPDNPLPSVDTVGTSGYGNEGIDLLGIDSFGQGRPDYSYVASFLVAAKVMPATVPGVTYSWDRVYKSRSIWMHWTGGLTGIGTWQVSSINNGTTLLTGENNPVEDLTNPVGTDHSVVPSAEQLLYVYDNPAMVLGNWSSATFYDIAYQETDFTYTLTINVGNASTSRSFHVGQTIIAKMGGSVANPVWQPVSNIVSTTSIPTCLINPAKVQAALSACGYFSNTYSINISSTANDPNPNP